MGPHGTVERDGEAWQVRFVRDLPSDPPEVWDAVTSPDRLARWLAPTDLEPRRGGALQVHFDDAAVTGEVQVWEPPRTFATTWVFADGTRTSVRIDLEPITEGTRLTLVHRDLPGPISTGYAAGWHAYLDRLAAVLVDAEPPTWDDRFGEVFEDYRATVR